MDLGLLRALDGRVDVLVANPPYIHPTPSRWTPRSATTTPTSPSTAVGWTGSRSRAPSSTRPRACCEPGGLLVMEHAEVQDAAARAAAMSTGAFEQIESRDDLTGRPRMLVARRSSHPLVTDSAP